MKNYIKELFLIIVPFCISCESDKLDIVSYGSIDGKVIDGESYLPIQGALITTTPASIAVLSNEKGEFTIPKIKVGDVALNIKKKDFLSSSLSVAIFENEATKMELLVFKEDTNIGIISLYDPVPGNGAVDQNLAVTLKWKAEGNKTNTKLSYNIYIFESNSTVQKVLGENIELLEVTTSGLKYSTTYYWYVVTKYEGDKIAFSPTWSFRTRDN